MRQAVDGSLRVLKSVDWRKSSKVLFSPDGKYLAFDLFAGDNAAQRDVFIMATDGSREIPAVVDPANDTVMGWSPDGKYLLFASDRSGSTDLWAMPFTNGKIVAPAERIKRDLGNVDSKGLSRAGALYYAVFSRNQNRTSVRTASFDFSADRFVTSPAENVPDFGGSSSQPSWSPDGKYLAYISQAYAETFRAADQTTLVIRATDSGQVRILRVMGSFGYTRWSPDGRSFAVAGRDAKGRRGIYRIDAQSGESALIAEGALDDPIWSKDGAHIFFKRMAKDRPMTLVSREVASGSEKELFSRAVLGFMSLSPDGRNIGIMVKNEPRTKPESSTKLILVPVSGGEPRELITHSGLGYPNFSPDGRYIATGSTDPAAKLRAMLLVPLQGGEVRHLMRVPDSLVISVVMWAPDSGSVFMMKRQANLEQTEVWRAPVDGGEPRRVGINADRVPTPFLVSPDGRHVAYTVAHGPTVQKPSVQQELWALENFLPKNK
jgi:Tol biopolymer transport system component